MVDIDEATVKRTKPHESELIPLKNLYLNQNLKEIAQKLERAYVYTSYITDLNDVIAIKDSPGTPDQLKNLYDWRLFQELMAQADVMITGSRYFNKVEELGAETAQNVISQFDEGAEFADLGEWRLNNGFVTRNPDVVVVSRSLNFKIPGMILNSDRRIIVFTTHEMFESELAFELQDQGADIVAAGVEGVNGRVMIDHLYHELGYQTIMMATGPSVLSILLESDVLDRFYITQVQREIQAEDDEKITVLENKKVEELVNFELTYEYLQENVETEDGQIFDQYFRLYENKKLHLQLR